MKEGGRRERARLEQVEYRNTCMHRGIDACFVYSIMCVCVLVGWLVVVGGVYAHVQYKN